MRLKMNVYTSIRRSNLPADTGGWTDFCLNGDQYKANIDSPSRVLLAYNNIVFIMVSVGLQ